MTTTADIPAPIQANGMRRVERAAFFAKMGPMNVHPCPHGRFHPSTGYVTEWRLAAGAGALVGVSDGRSERSARYWLP